jgi:hypothetical protein
MKLLVAIAALVAGLSASVAFSAPIQWTSASGGNNHFYEAVLATPGITWTGASANATAAGGYLATLTSAPENSFVFGLLAGNTNYWVTDSAGNKQGPWLGGFQPPGSVEPGGGWSWVTGEAFTFTAWSAGEPNNSGSVEDSLQFFSPGSGTPSSPRWNDAHGSNGNVRGYIVEFNTLPVPEPSSFAMFAAGILVMGSAARRRKSIGL